LDAGGIISYGNGWLYGAAGVERYLNWGTTAGSSGYGIRANSSGVLEFKNSGGNWAAFAGGGGIPWITSGNNIYNNNSGNVGIGVTNPTHRLHVQGPATTAVHGIVSTAGVNDNATYGIMGIASTYYGALGRGDGYSFVGNGALYNNGTAYATSFLYISDARLKENVAPLEKGVLTIGKLRPVSFTWKEGVEGGRSGKDDIGFIAQEVEKIVPGAVYTDTATKLKAVDYPKLVPILVQAVQEQQAEIDALKAEVEALKRAR
jgi:hypothetical protein